MEEEEIIPDRTKAPYSPDLHLKTAIRIYERRMFIQGLTTPSSPVYQPVKRSLEAFNSLIPKPEGTLRSDSEYLYGRVLTPACLKVGIVRKLTRHLTENLRISSFLTSVAIDVCFADINERLGIADVLKKKISDLKLPDNLTRWFVYRNLWESIRDVMKDKQIKEDYRFEIIGEDLTDSKLYVNPYFLIYEEQRGTSWLLDYSQVLMLSDTIGSRFLSLLYCHLQGILEWTPMPSSEELSSFYSIGDGILSRHGNVGYDYLKPIESICIAGYLKLYEPLEISKGYIHQLLDECGDDDVAKEYTNRFFSLITEIGTHPLKIIELFGCFRHFGHPTVDEISGIDSLRENSRRPLVIDETQLKKVTGAFNRMIILEFISQRKRWPKCHIPDSSRSQDLKLLLQNKPLAISEYDLQISLADWAEITFEQEFQFDDFPDYTSLLSDTAISPYLENWYTVYSRDLLNVAHPTHVEESRRVLIEVLKRDKIDCKEIRETIQKGEIPERWLIVGLHSKERELKRNARLFAMMCLEMRLYFNMTEKNVAEKIFPLIPYQTMTWTDAELTKAMLRLSSLHSEEDIGKADKYVYVIISLDFNKFNQKWRFESTYPIFKNIDDLMGTPNLLVYSHKFFQKAFFYLSSHLRPPATLRRTNGQSRQGLPEIDPLIFQSETTWVGQEGGCEGLRQKPWTAVIVSALVANSFDTGVSGHIIGQGDNQVIVAAFKMLHAGITIKDYLAEHEEEITMRIKAYMDNLQTITSGIGMDLKLQESWISTKILNYGKEIIIDGSYASGGIKKISRAYQEVSELYPSLQNRIAAIFTSAQSTSLKSYDTIIPYLIAVFDSLNMLSKESLYGTTMAKDIKQVLQAEKIQMDEHLKMVYLLLPRECGGLPVIPHLNLQFRGHPDQFTSTLCWLKQISCQIPVAKRLLNLITTGYFNSQTTDALQLIQDPYSLNFNRPVQATNKIKHVLIGIMKDVTQNRDVCRIIDHCDEESLRTLAEYLFKSRPLFPRVLNEILRLSPDGSLLSFLSIFKDMRTMKQLLPGSSAAGLVAQLKEYDLSTVRHIIRLSKLLRSDSTLPWIEKNLKVNPQGWLQEKQHCLTMLAYELRHVTWGVPVEGVSIPHPSEQAQMFLSNGDFCDYPHCKGTEMIVYVVLDERIRPTEPLHFDKGPLRHYLGSGTSEKRSGPVLVYPRTEKALRAAQQLLRVKNWTVQIDDETNTLTPFLDELIQSRCNACEEFLILTSGVNYGGSIQHRFSDVTSKHECRSGIRVNHHSRVMITSDQLGKYARGKDNYPIVFQALYLHALHKISVALLVNPDLLKSGNLVFHQHLTCEGCLSVIEEPPMVNTSSPPEVAKLQDCALIYSTVDESLSNIPLSCVENIAMVEPSPSDPEILSKSAFAAALLIIGESSHVVTPLIHSGLRYQNRDGTLVCLTVGFFIKIGLRNLFKQLAVVWILDNLPQIVSQSLRLSCSLADSMEILLDRYPDFAWDLLKPYLCLKEVQQEARNKLGMVSTSSEIFLTGKGLGYSISQVICKVGRSLLSDNRDELNQKDFRIPFITTTPGISLNRVSYIWVNSCMITSNWSTVGQLDALIQIGREVLLQCIHPEAMDLSKLMVLLANITVGDLSLSHCITGHRLKLSRVGVEPWVVPQLLPDKKKHVVGISRVNPTRIDHDVRGAIRVILRRIGLRIRTSLGTTNHTTDNVSIPTEIRYPERVTHCRSDHYYRLVGKYSTAGLKYAQLIHIVNGTPAQATVHLAEGAGGVARLSHLFLGVATIVYNSLIEIGPGLNHRAYHYIPSELQGLTGITIIGPSLCYQTGGDINKRSTISRYQHVICENRDKILLITCDAEFPREGDLDSARALLVSFLQICSPANRDTLLIFKTFSRLIEVLITQIGIWSQVVMDPEITVPSFSSHESSEVFLMGRRGVRDLMGYDSSIVSAYNVGLAHSILDNRQGTSPFLSNVDTSILRDLYLFLHHLGIDINYYQAIQVFLNHSVSQSVIEESVLKAIYLAIEHSRMRVDERVKIFQRLSRGRTLPILSRLIVQSMRKESRELYLAAETMFNANVLRHIMLTGSVPPELFINDWTIEDDTQVLYTYTPVWTNWVATYGRSFYKILGHHEILLEKRISLPPYIRNTISLPS